MSEVEDPGLRARIDELLGDRHPVAAAATVSAGDVALTARGASLGADYEIGSVSKGVTGLLYADAVDRGEVSAGTTLGELLPLDGARVAAVTLGAVSTHRSGLPRLPPGTRPLRGTVALWRHGTNPYGERLEELLEQARRARVGRSRMRYSNLGYELLGHALAAAAGTSYADLVRRRIADPLGLDPFYVPETAAELRPGALAGTNRSGRPVEPWTGAGLGPAGGIRAAIGAMARLTAALLDGTAPGLRALDPVAPMAGRAVRIGAAWVVLERKGTVVTWHNGGTGGFRSWLGVDRAAGTGAVLLTATSRSVDRQGFDLLAGLSRRRPG